MVEFISRTLGLVFREQWALENAINGLKSLITGGGARGFIATLMMIMEMFGMLLGGNAVQAKGSSQQNDRNHQNGNNGKQNRLFHARLPPFLTPKRRGAV